MFPVLSFPASPCRRSLNSWRPARRQRGWSLLESALCVVLAGLLGLAAAGLLAPVRRVSRQATTEDVLGRAEHALLGYAWVHARLPRPRGGGSVAFGWLEGDWDAAALGLEMPATVRWRVDPALVVAPALVYEPDPRHLAGAPDVARTQANGLDFCLRLMSPPAGATPVVAFGLRLGQTGDVGEAGEAADAVASRGHAEFAFALGCHDRLSALALAVKAAAAGDSLAALAEQDVRLKDIGVRVARQAQSAGVWQLVNLQASMARYLTEQTLLLVQLQSTPLAVLRSAGGLASVSAAIVATSLSTALAARKFGGLGPGIATAEQARQASIEWGRSLQAQHDAQVARVQRLVSAGLAP